MERFAVVACPRCGWVRGVEIGIKNTKCIQCNKRMSLSELVFLAVVDRQENLPGAVATVRAHLSKDSGLVIPVLEDMPSPSQTNRPPKKESMESLFALLSEGGSENFSREELLEVARENDISSPDEKLESFIQGGLIAEVEPGILMWLG